MPTALPALRAATLRAATLTVAFLGAAAPVRAQTFDFETAPFGPVPLVLQSGGVTATFAAPSGGFEILDFGPGAFAALDGRVLGAVDADLVVEPLTIAFDRPLASLSLAFALNDFLGGSGLTLRAFLGGAPAGAPVTVGGTVPAGLFFPEGTIAFAAAPFDRVELSSDAVDFFIDAVAVSAVPVSAVPEPATTALLAVGLLGLAGGVGAARRRRAVEAAGGRTPRPRPALPPRVPGARAGAPHHPHRSAP